MVHSRVLARNIHYLLSLLVLCLLVALASGQNTVFCGFDGTSDYYCSGCCSVGYPTSYLENFCVAPGVSSDCTYCIQSYSLQCQASYSSPQTYDYGYSSPPPPSSYYFFYGSSKSSLPIIIGVVVPLVVIAILVGVVLFVCWRRRQAKKLVDHEEKSGGPSTVPFDTTTTSFDTSTTVPFDTSTTSFDVEHVGKNYAQMDESKGFDRGSVPFSSGERV